MFKNITFQKFYKLFKTKMKHEKNNLLKKKKRKKNVSENLIKISQKMHFFVNNKFYLCVLT